jgi:protein ImuA
MADYPFPSRDVQQTVQELRKRLGLFSFQEEDARAEAAVFRSASLPELGLPPGGVVEWLVGRPGAGAVTSAMHILARSRRAGDVWAVVDPLREFYIPALSGWGVRPSSALLIRPATPREMCWAIEQCLRCPGVAATWTWVDQRFPALVHRRWKRAAETGGGVGLFFRPDRARARREPVWADLRLRLTPRAGGPGDVRQMTIEVLYRRGGLGGSAQAWEIDHAAGGVRVVPELAHPATVERTARA